MPPPADGPVFVLISVESSNQRRHGGFGPLAHLPEEIDRPLSMRPIATFKLLDQDGHGKVGPLVDLPKRAGRGEPDKRILIFQCPGQGRQGSLGLAPHGCQMDGCVRSHPVVVILERFDCRWHGGVGSFIEDLEVGDRREPRRRILIRQSAKQRRHDGGVLLADARQSRDRQSPDSRIFIVQRVDQGRNCDGSRHFQAGTGPPSDHLVVMPQQCEQGRQRAPTKAPQRPGRIGADTAIDVLQDLEQDGNGNFGLCADLAESPSCALLDLPVPMVQRLDQRRNHDLGRGVLARKSPRRPPAAIFIAILHGPDQCRNIGTGIVLSQALAWERPG